MSHSLQVSKAESKQCNDATIQEGFRRSAGEHALYVFERQMSIQDVVLKESFSLEAD